MSKKLTISAMALCSLVGTASTQGTFFKEARVPVLVNADATVSIHPLDAAMGMGAEKTVSANVWDTLIIMVNANYTSISHRTKTHNSANYAPITARYNRGTVSVELSSYYYKDATLSIHSINGKRILSDKISALNSNNTYNISRPSVAPGVYLLSIKGVNGNSYSTRLAHGGGRLDVNAKFGAGDIRSLGKEASSMSLTGTTWKLTAAASGYKTFEDTFPLNLGLGLWRVITLVPETDGNYETFVDSRDGAVYKMVTIGAQVWMAENLNYRNTAGNSDTVGMCYEYSADSCAKYGRLYDWNTAMAGAPSSSLNPSGVRGICPAGWHLPGDAEWGDLTKYIGGDDMAGIYLKSQTGWDPYKGVSGGTDYYGFSSLPGGNLYPTNPFDGLTLSSGAGDRGIWLTATEYDEANARCRRIDYNRDDVSSPVYGKTYAFSVRCVRD